MRKSMQLQKSVQTLLIILLAGIIPACNKSDEVLTGDRQIKFELYTSKDFSKYNGNITFTMKITAGNTVLWDSILPPMQVRDIPAAANKITVVKTISGQNNKVLKAGFYYTLENVGISWYTKPVGLREQFKLISYDFQ